MILDKVKILREDLQTSLMLFLCQIVSVVTLNETLEGLKIVNCDIVILFLKHSGRAARTIVKWCCAK